MRQYLSREFVFSRQWNGYDYLISPFLDFMFAGGLAACLLVALVLFYPPGHPDFYNQYVTVGLVMGIVAYVINHPHFMVSYQILYRDFGSRLRRFKQHRELWIRLVVAGIIVPVFLAGYFAYGMITARPEFFVWGIQAMLIIVGWHYVKQAFGVFIMLAAVQKVYYSGWRRLFLLGNCYVVWVCFVLSYFSGSLSAGDVLNIPDSNYWGFTDIGFPYYPISDTFPHFLAYAILVSESLAALAILSGEKIPPLSAFIGYFSMYFLLFAWMYHPMWWIIAPALHSLQYLMFVYAYKRGETAVAIHEKHENPKKANLRLYGFIALSVIFSLLFMEPFPALAEEWLNPDKSLLLPLAAAFIVTINIQHYFIDNVLWRKENTEVGKYMFYR